MFRFVEELTLNAWPAMQTVIVNGWLLRHAEGYTKRSNSVSPLYDASIQDVQQNIERCERFYSGLGQDVIFKITPYVKPEGLDQHLENLGYRFVDESSVRVLELAAVPAPSLRTVSVKEQADDEWLDQLAVINELSFRNKKITRDLLKLSRLKKCCVTAYSNEGVPVACGLGVIQDGYIGLYDIVTDKRFRRQGYGEQLLLHILNWGKRNGAEYSYLQVVVSNAAASRLYDKLGYREIYRYWYRVK